MKWMSTVLCSTGWAIEERIQTTVWSLPEKKGASKGKGGQIYGDGNDLTLGGGPTIQYADHVS